KCIAVGEASIQAHLSHERGLSHELLQKANLGVSLSDQLRMESNRWNHETAALGPAPVLRPRPGGRRNRERHNPLPITLSNVRHWIGKQVNVAMKVKSSCRHSHSGRTSTSPMSISTSSIPRLNTSAYSATSAVL